ncbi:MAG: glycosyltransferase family 2 protein, partial [Candidatus Marinimicrobia bacterium]|nr:glycosyltransferase family 2 protein [Candidatus Neomarinimicrobiota bacterium]
LIRRKLVEEIGFFDDQYFAYQEDSDYCIRAKKRGWKIFFVPSSTLIHIQGTGGSNTFPHRSIYEWHRSYFLFYKKHFADNYFFLFNFIFYIMMMLKLISTEIVYTLRS